MYLIENEITFTSLCTTNQIYIKGFYFENNSLFIHFKDLESYTQYIMDLSVNGKDFIDFFKLIIKKELGIEILSASVGINIKKSICTSMNVLINADCDSINNIIGDKKLINISGLYFTNKLSFYTRDVEYLSFINALKLFKIKFSLMDEAICSVDEIILAVHDATYLALKPNRRLCTIII